MVSAPERFKRVSGMKTEELLREFTGRKAAGVFSAYVPFEIYHSAGYHPVYLFTWGCDSGLAAEYLPGFCCFPGRNLVEHALAGELSRLSCIVFSATCDTVQSIYDILKVILPDIPVHYLKIPALLSREIAMEYLEAEIDQLIRKSGNIEKISLRRSISLYNEKRRLTARLNRIAWEITPTDYYAIIKAGMILPVEEYNLTLSSFLREIEELNKKVSPSSSIRLVIAGSHFGEENIFRIIEESGMLVVGEFLDGLTLFRRGEVDEENEPLSALARFIFNQVATATKVNFCNRREDYLVDLVREGEADGVILLRRKFCDPYGFDAVLLTTRLEEEGVPYLIIEVDEPGYSGQIKTRVEAFLEMLEIGR
ncbi:MAG: hypothetical protein DRP87_13460 [Spirochaetes bacterium]|nr:MAG: hypothetical protein DRP87_13460 [Spirochaetota bacterium]